MRAADSSKQASNVPPQVWLKVTIGGREVPWLTRMAELLILPFIQELHDRVAEQFAAWLDKNPESAP